MIDRNAYFRRIGWTGPDSPSPTLEVLSALCLRHTASIPFENLDILLGRPIKLDLASLSAKLIDAKRGGYCFEQNALFKDVLTQLGFRVTPLSARVRLGVPADVPTARTHMLLRVDLVDGAYLADVGFGFTPTAPLRLEAALEQRLHLSTYRLSRQGTVWTLEILQAEGFVPAYVFTEEPSLPVDYEVANHFTSTHASSFFTQAPLVMRHDPEGGARYVLRGREWSVRRGTEVETHTVTSQREALRVLGEKFGLPFAKGTVFRGIE